jgi:3',5'-cyclic AMP phosphodiesterase CpdA
VLNAEGSSQVPLLLAAEPAPKNADRAVIAHISDLHFTTKSQRSDAIWQALCEDLRGVGGIDLVAVTGDVVDSSVSDNFGPNGVRTAFQRVRTYLLDDVCPAAAVNPDNGMFVIPGNHDFRMKGLVWKDLQFDLFYEHFGVYFSNRIFDALGLSVFVFDSNSPDRPLNFASGLVRENDLVTHHGLVRQMGTEHPKFASECTNVVLIHHHPLPIAPTQHREDLTAGEEFMLLKNAGIFMEQMVRTKMDLVLHGHRHYPAYARISFPTSEGGRHSIAVVAAGSVGLKGDHDYSYNLITIRNNREIMLERRVLRAALYETDGQPFFISTYEDARRKRCVPNKSDRRQIRADKYVRIDSIRAGSGDDVMDETFSNARAANKFPIADMPRTLSSNSGIFGDWAYDVPRGQSMEWEWDGPAEDGNRKGHTRIDPPLGPTPITFSRKGTTFNAIHFNRRDRLDATEHQDKEEWVTMATRHLYDSAILQVNFPPASFPSDFRIEVRQEDDKTRDFQEEEYLRSRLTRFPNINSVVLAFDTPIPKFSYRIKWDLPADDTDELGLSAAELGLASAISDRLLLLVSDLKLRSAVTQSMAHLRETILSVPAYAATERDDSEEELEIELFAYDSKRGGLVFVATLPDRNAAVAQCVIKPGRFVVGQAFRRREEVVLINVPGVKTDGCVYYEAVPGLQHLAPHTVVFAMPLLYPIRKGVKIGAIALGSRSKTSGLLCLHKDRAALLALKEQLSVWFAKELVPALGMNPLSV